MCVELNFFATFSMILFPPLLKLFSKSFYSFKPIKFPQCKFPPSITSCNYCSLGWAHEVCKSPAHQLFDGIPQRDVIHFDSHACSLAGDKGREGDLRSVTSMLLYGVRPDRWAVSCFIRAISSTGLEDLKHGIHAVVIKTGFESEISIATALLGFYSSMNDLESARQIFDWVPAKDLILWSAMVSACCKNGQFAEAITTFREMQYFGVCPNAVSLVSVLPACANTGDVLCGKQIHGFSIRREFHSEASLWNSLIDMYAKCGKVDASTSVFDGFKEKDVFSWRNVILGCIVNGQPRKALILFSSMRASEVKPEEITVRNVIGVCTQIGDLELGLGLHGYSIKNGFSCSTSIGTVLLRMYAEFKDVGTAHILFDLLSHKDCIAWSAMVSVYSNIGQPALALNVFKQMQSANVEANEITLVSLLRACSSMESQKQVRSIHAYVVRLGYAFNMFIASCLIDFYCKIGRLTQGEVLFNKLQSKDLVCWSSMIHGYGVNGFGEEAIQTFSNMLNNGMMPNDVVFVSLLSACSHCGMVDEGWKWYYAMEEKYGVSPTMAHYTCIVDMLGRRGKLDEALEFINRLPIEPDASLWGTLLSWCRTTLDDIKVAEVAAEHLFRLDSTNPSYFVTLSNMYCKLGRWDDVERIRWLIQERGLKKQAGYSVG